MGKAYCTDCKLFAGTLAFLGSECLGEPVGARAEAKGASFDLDPPVACHYLCLDLETKRKAKRALTRKSDHPRDY